MKKGYEIERKFLISSLPEDLEKMEHHHIIQSYVSRQPTIRIRKWDDTYVLTVKGGGLMKRMEFEMALSQEEFENLQTKAEDGTIDKVRYIYPIIDGLIAEIDIYSGHLKGFMNVEVEFPDERTALLFSPPEWFGREITGDYRFSNSFLSKFGVQKIL